MAKSSRPKTKRRTLRVLVLMHVDLVPPDDVSESSPQRLQELRTEYEVVRGLRKLGHTVLPLGLLDDIAPLREALAGFDPHVVFNLLEEFHGSRTLDQNVVSYLELSHTPYTGCNPRGLIIARDKALSKKILHYHRVGVPAFAVFRRGRAVRRPVRLEFPLIVKPLGEEASQGISEASLVHADDKLVDRVAFIHESIGSDAIVEQYIDGREFYGAVIGNERLQVFPPWELSFENPRPDVPLIATRAAKWDSAFQDRRGVVIGPAKGLSEGAQQRLARTAKRIYRALGLSGYARLDFRLAADERLYFLEANPNPDIQKDGEFASAGEDAGLAYCELLQRILMLGIGQMRGFVRTLEAAG